MKGYRINQSLLVQYWKLNNDGIQLQKLCENPESRFPVYKILSMFANTSCSPAAVYWHKVYSSKLPIQWLRVEFCITFNSAKY